MASLSRTITLTILVCFAWLALVLGLLSFAPNAFDVGQDLTIFLISGIIAAGAIASLWIRWFFWT